MRRSTRETKRVVLYEYRDADSMAAPAAKPVHKNHLAKSEGPQTRDPNRKAQDQREEESGETPT